MLDMRAVACYILLMTLQARFSGRCSTCNKTFEAGAPIEWDRATKRTQHAACVPGAAERLATQAVAVAASRASTPEEAPEAVREVALTVPCPDGLEYLPFQRAGIAYAAQRAACLIADEMGLGKTIQAAGAINADPTIQRVIVVSPASLRLNWVRELTRWLVRPLSIALADASDWPAADIVVVTWDSARKLRVQIDATEWDLAIVDEAHYGKTPTSQRSKAVFGTEARGRGEARKPGDPGIKARRKLALTGTPITNRPAEIHPTLRWLDPPTWGRFWPFGLRFCAGYRGPWGWDFTGSSNLGELQTKLRSTIMVRRLKADVLTELPAKRRQVVVMPPNGALGAVRAEAAAWRAHEETIEAARAAVELSKASDAPQEYEAAVARLNAVTRVAFADISRVRHETALAKVPAVLEHAQDALEQGGKLVIFAHHHDVIAALREGLADAQPAVLTGETPMAERQAAVDRFQGDPACRVFIGSITAAGVGITLTASAHAIFAELDWVPGNVTQAEDRCHRIGQASSVLVQHLVLDGSLDARMATVLVEKQDVIDRALDRATESVLANEPAVPGEQAATATAGRKQLDVVALTLTPEQIAEIHEGLRRLAGMCDGARTLDGSGFSKIDVRIGHALAEAARLSPRQAALGLRLTRKYRRQLGSVMA